MKLEYEVEEYEARIRPECNFDETEVWIKTALFEACIPEDFLRKVEPNSTINSEAWDTRVSPYIDNIRIARRKRYGLYFSGDNGSGKTFFMTYVLQKAIEAGYSAYYTTLLDLDAHLKMGMRDQETMRRLDTLLYYSDFLGIDEMSKERFRDGDSWMRTQVERVLKSRYDNVRPTLIASNVALKSAAEAYGNSVYSVVFAQCEQVALTSKDLRKGLKTKMFSEMKYKK